MLFELTVLVVAVAAGAVASVSGFGIGSTLTPLLATAVDTRLAVAAVAIPHVIGTALRFWTLRGHLDRNVLETFGLTSAAGGLAGAILHTWLQSSLLARVLGAVLVFAGLGGLTGWTERVRLSRRQAWFAGGASGLFGGLVGNQGGIRSAALLAFDVSPRSFVATATAIALMVDAARLPVYLVQQPAGLASLWKLIILTTIGVVVGTVAGQRVLSRIPVRTFRRVVSAFILALGIAMFFIAR